MQLKLKELADGISIAQLGSVFFGVVYISGYLVSAFYVRSRGIATLPLLKAQYIETGLVFLIITGLIAAIPMLIVNMAVYGRVKHKQRVTPTVAIPVLVTTNFLLVFLFWAVFVTEFEWASHATVFGVDIPVKVAFPAYIVAMFVLLPALPIIRMADCSQRGFLFLPRLSSEIDNTLTSRPINVIVQIMRVLALLITVAFDCLLLVAIPWLAGFLIMGLYYVLTVLFLVGTVHLVRYLTDIYRETGRRAAVWVVGIPLLLSSYYFCAIAYSYVVYNNIPVSRGGRYPTTKVVLRPSQTSPPAWPKEVYVLEETEDTMYVVATSLQDWFTSHEDVTAIPRSQVVPFQLIHLSNGEPRMNHIRNRSKGGCSYQ
ncbi:MAG: hypothetical protein JW818_06320 [Pirellulales bacterium]|nr:hypothetical protein [Pirellulales bacterium]